NVYLTSIRRALDSWHRSLSSLFTEPEPAELYTLSLHDALPILDPSPSRQALPATRDRRGAAARRDRDRGRERDRSRHEQRTVGQDRKSTRLNSSHVAISYAVFCLKKKKQKRSATPVEY